jgi:nucleoside-diphosphate-sugar epimerase
VNKLNVLITGGGGYIGIPTTELFLKKGHNVTILDRFFFGTEYAESIKNKNLRVIRDDIRWFDPDILKEIDIVLDLASISNDPSGELNPAKTLDINYLGRVRVAKLCKMMGVKRYILASTCSVYGFHDEILDETSPTNPLTTYAKSAVMAEKDIIPLADKDFTVVVPRFSTVYGYAPRMRLDLAINAMTLRLYETGKITVSRDGTQWRPFVHVQDVAKSYSFLAEAPAEKVNGEIFNVGSNEQNYQILPLAETIGDAIGKPYEIIWYGDPDKRSYRVDSSKIRDKLGFKPDWTPATGAKQVYIKLESRELEDSTKCWTVKWYKHLLNSEKLLNEIKLHDTVL